MGTSWRRSGDAAAMLGVLLARTGRRGALRRERLYACGCCRLVWGLLADRRSRRAVEAAERFADGGLAFEELERVGRAAHAAVCAASEGWWQAGARADDPRAKPVKAADAAWRATADWRRLRIELPTLALEVAAAVGRQGPAALLRDVFGPDPARRPVVRRRWASAAAVGLARGIYAGRAFGGMPALADALEEAGCDDRAVLAHCRGPGPHARGCWVLDGLLGRR